MKRTISPIIILSMLGYFSKIATSLKIIQRKIVNSYHHSSREDFSNIKTKDIKKLM